MFFLSFNKYLLSIYSLPDVANKVKSLSPGLKSPVGETDQIKSARVLQLQGEKQNRIRRLQSDGGDGSDGRLGKASEGGGLYMKT